MAGMGDVQVAGQPTPPTATDFQNYLKSSQTPSPAHQSYLQSQAPSPAMPNVPNLTQPYVGMGDLRANESTGMSAPTQAPNFGKGNIDLNHRPIIHNSDGSYSTVRSLTFTLANGKYILLPSVRWGLPRIMTPQESIQYYEQSGEHLGIFDSEADADNYAQTLHENQAAQYDSQAGGS
jgi:hypothetical protein